MAATGASVINIKLGEPVVLDNISVIIRGAGAE